MVIKPDQQKMQQLLSEAITVLCKNGLNYQSHVNVEALIGITLDDDEVFLVSVRETIQSIKLQQMAIASPTYSSSPAHRPKATPNRKRTASNTTFQAQHTQQAINIASSDHGATEHASDSGEPPAKRAVNDSDVIHIKGEHSDDEERGNAHIDETDFQDDQQSAELPDDGGGGGGEGDTYDTSQLEQFVDFANTSQSTDLNQIDSKAAVFANQATMNPPVPDPTYAMASPSLTSSSHHQQIKSSHSRTPQQVGTFFYGMIICQKKKKKKNKDK